MPRYKTRFVPIALRSRTRCRRTEIEIHGWRFLRALLGSEEWTRRKSEHPGDRVGRKTAHGGIEVLHRAVEIISFDRHPVFRAFEMRLKSEKILTRLQIGITFDH